jgi:hypothetical protein
MEWMILKLIFAIMIILGVVAHLAIYGAYYRLKKYHREIWSRIGCPEAFDFRAKETNSNFREFCIGRKDKGLNDTQLYCCVITYKLIYSARYFIVIFFFSSVRLKYFT